MTVVTMVSRRLSASGMAAVGCHPGERMTPGVTSLAVGYIKLMQHLPQYMGNIL